MTLGADQDLIGRGPGGRKLIAVAHADMVGYSRLIGLDDAGTLRRLRILRRALIDPAIREYGGKIVQTGGDSLLVVFDSIDGAIQCAVKIQQQIPVYDGDQTPDRSIRFRIGVNIGDVIADGTDYHGDGVNIAARLQADCPAGGVCVSRSVRDHVHGRLNLEFEELGPLKLKNIVRPVDAFVWRADPENASSSRFTRPDDITDGNPKHEPVRITPIQTFYTPLGFFIFVVLIVDAIIGVLAGFSGSADRSALVEVMAAIIVLLIGVVALLAWFRPEALMGVRANLNPVPRPNSDHLKVFERSNDFLATGDNLQFPSILKNTRKEAWFVGATFYITVGQYRDLLLDRLSDGVDLHFMILDPGGRSVALAAGYLGVTEKELTLDCLSGIRVLDRTLVEACNANCRGKLQIKLIDEPIQTRLYIFDPESENGYVYFIPQINGTNSQTVPGYLVSQLLGTYKEAYFKGISNMWNNAVSKTLEAWKLAHPDFE